MKLRIEVDVTDVDLADGANLSRDVLTALKPYVDTTKEGVISVLTSPESEADKVAEVVRTLNDLIRWTGLTVVGTLTSPTSLRVVRAGNLYQSSGGPTAITVDAVHFQMDTREWLDGADDRRKKDPVWADRFWGPGGRRAAGNVRLAGRGPRGGETVEQLVEMANRRPEDEVPRDPA